MTMATNKIRRDRASEAGPLRKPESPLQPLHGPAHGLMPDSTVRECCVFLLTHATYDVWWCKRQRIMTARDDVFSWLGLHYSPGTMGYPEFASTRGYPAAVSEAIDRGHKRAVELKLHPKRPAVYAGDYNDPDATGVTP